MEKVIEMKVEWPMNYIFDRCETVCVQACCGADAYDISPLHIASILLLFGNFTITILAVITPIVTLSIARPGKLWGSIFWVIAIFILLNTFGYFYLNAVCDADNYVNCKAQWKRLMLPHYQQMSALIQAHLAIMLSMIAFIAFGKETKA